MRYVMICFIYMLLFIIVFFGCSEKNSDTTKVYTAEKMFYHAEQVKKNILINPDIVSPDQFANAEMLYREIINTFNDQKTNNKQIRNILRRSWLTIAELYQIQKKIDSANKVYNEILEQSPDDRELCSVALFSMARNYEQSKRIDDAIKCYQNILKNYPPVLGDTLLPNYNILQTPLHVARLYRQMGNTLLMKNQYQDALKYYEGLIQKWPDSEIALAAENMVAVSYADQGSWQRAAEILNKIILKYPGKNAIPNIMFSLGQLYQQQLNQPLKALEIYNQITKQYPENSILGRVHLSMGGIYFNQQNYERARYEFRYVIDNYRNDQNSSIAAQFSIARSYELENNWNKALNEYQWILKNYPNNIQSLNVPLYIAKHYEQEDQPELAMNAYEDAVRHFQQIKTKYANTILAALALDYAAAAYIKLEKWHEAANMFEQLLEMQLPANKQVNTFFALEKIYEEKLNDTEKAVATYKRLLEKHPNVANASQINEKAKQLQLKLERYKQTNQPPQSSEIVNVNLLSTSSLVIQWRQNNEDDFLQYRLIRSEKPGVDLQDKIVAEIANRQQTEFVDNNVKEGRTYYYRLVTFDKGGLNVGSNEVSIQVKPKEIVGTINLQARSDSWSSILLAWNRYNGDDFDSYKIYRSSKPGVSFNSQLVKSIFDQQSTQLQDNDLKENTTYYYKAFVYNIDGANKPSNEVKVTTSANAPPRSVRLNVPLKVDRSSVELSWTTSNEEDFSMYRIFRAEKSPVSLVGTSIWMNSNREIAKYKDTGLTAGKSYFYKVVVYDKGGLYSESNEVSITF